MRVSVSPKVTVFPCFTFTTAFREMMLEVDLPRTIAEPTSPAARFFRIPGQVEDYSGNKEKRKIIVVLEPKSVSRSEMTMV